jgi:hypothetical protein
MDDEHAKRPCISDDGATEDLLQVKGQAQRRNQRGSLLQVCQFKHISVMYASYPSSDCHLNKFRNERKIEDVGEHLGHRDGGNFNSWDTHQRNSELRL